MPWSGWRGPSEMRFSEGPRDQQSPASTSSTPHRHRRRPSHIPSLLGLQKIREFSRILQRIEAPHGINNLFAAAGRQYAADEVAELLVDVGRQGRVVWLASKGLLATGNHSALRQLNLDESAELRLARLDGHGAHRRSIGEGEDRQLDTASP